MPKINIQVEISDNVYLRDPQETELGKRILKHSIILFNEVGFEAFTFKKLASAMESTEASVYRYFENKYKLLSYLVAWYWDFMHFMILMRTEHIEDPAPRLDQMIHILVELRTSRSVPDFIDQEGLHNIVVENAAKVYHNKAVDSLNRIGFYSNLKKLANLFASVIGEVNPDFKYPKGLAGMIIDQSLNAEYYAAHLPALSDFGECEESLRASKTADMLVDMVSRSLRK